MEADVKLKSKMKKVLFLFFVFSICSVLSWGQTTYRLSSTMTATLEDGTLTIISSKVGGGRYAFLEQAFFSDCQSSLAYQSSRYLLGSYRFKCDFHRRKDF